MKRLSIIIPVYNVEQYLAKCLNSVIQQDVPYEDYEVIVVNDGSPDNSLKIAEQYADKYSNIKVITRLNGGLSAARNTGFECANGEYVWFVDSDDWIEPNCLNFLLTEATQKQLDVLCFGVSYHHSENVIEPCAHRDPKSIGVVDGKIFLCKTYMPSAVWCALYRREFLTKNNLLFYEGILHEDQEFTPRAYFFAKRIEYLHRFCYCYNQRMGSIMKSNQNVRRCRDFITICDSLYKFTCDNIPKDLEVYQYFMARIAFCFTQSLRFYSREAFSLSQLRQKQYYPLYNSRFMTKELRKKILFANFSLKLYMLIIKLI